jgi:hypothetical protein
LRSRALKRAQGELHARLLREVSPSGFERTARALGFWPRDRTSLEDEERRPFEDFAIYELREGGLNAPERLLQHHDLTPAQRTVLEAMVRARLAVLEIDEVQPDVGLHGRDMLREERWWVADPSLCRLTAVGDLMATRLLTFGDFALTTGGELRFDRSLAPAILQLCGV